jgi:type IV pilus assembly protein PilA
MQMTMYRRQAGFTLVELMIVIAIVGILAAVALGQIRDYTRRARMSEVVLAASSCRTPISESYLSLSRAPAAGQWGCESSAGVATRYAQAVQTSSDGVVRVTIANLDAGVNGRHMFLVPLRPDGVTAMSAADDLGNKVHQWICGSDAQDVRNALPVNCRSDTTAYAGGTFE